MTIIAAEVHIEPSPSIPSYFKLLTESYDGICLISELASSVFDSVEKFAEQMPSSIKAVKTSLDDFLSITSCFEFFATLLEWLHLKNKSPLAITSLAVDTVSSATGLLSFLEDIGLLSLVEKFPFLEPIFSALEAGSYGMIILKKRLKINALKTEQAKAQRLANQWEDLENHPQPSLLQYFEDKFQYYQSKTFQRPSIKTSKIQEITALKETFQQSPQIAKHFCERKAQHWRAKAKNLSNKQTRATLKIVGYTASIALSILSVLSALFFSWLLIPILIGTVALNVYFIADLLISYYLKKHPLPAKPNLEPVS